MTPQVENPSAKLPVAVEVERVCDRFEAAWRGGKRARVEDFVHDTPEPVYTPLLRELVLLEREYRQLNGEDSRPEEYHARFPSLPRGWLEDKRAGAAPDLAGRFRLLGEIGRGGMGVVYRASDPDCQREVAVKVLHERYAGEPDLERRFLEGAQLTGQLQHPGVPPVHEVGRLQDGRPFFAMKLVQGRTLTELLDQRQGPGDGLARWLGVFAQVCQAVACAHARGVIHRDLKPSNVMVGEFGEVQVMDWGLARRLRTAEGGSLVSESSNPPPALPDVADQSTVAELKSDSTGPGPQLTQEGSVVGTPAYMPPEQARGQVQALDARADVFGLGGILCEVLTGRPPHVATDHFNVLVKAARADLAETFARIEASGADAELVKLARECLAADRDDRPRDAGAVAEAVAAYQVGVEQRLRRAEMERAALEVRDREQRKRRRLRLALVASLLVLVTLFGGVGAWFAWQRDQARRDAEGLLDLAADLQQHSRWAEARKALIQAEARLESVGPADLRERVRQAAADLEWSARLDAIRLRRWTIVEGKVDVALPTKEYAGVFADAGLDVMAADLSAVAEQIRRSAVRKVWVAALDDWALATEEQSLRERILQTAREADPDRDEWRDRLRSPAVWGDRAALERLAEAPPADPPLSPQLLGVLAQRLHATGGDAIPLLRSSLQRQPNDFWLNFLLGNLLLRKPDVEAAEAMIYLRSALVERPDSPVVWNNIGVAHEKRGRLDDAVAAYRAALRDEPSFARAHYNLGVVLRHKGDDDGAIAAYREAVRHDPGYAKALNNLGVLYLKKDRKDDAINAFAQVARLEPELVEANQNLAHALKTRGQLNAALDTHRAAVQRAPASAQAHFNLANTLIDRKLRDEAIAAYREAIRLGANDPRFHSNLAVVLADKGQLDEAIAAHREAVRLDAKDSRILYNLGNALALKDQFDEAAAAYRQALAIDPRLASAHNNLGAALERNGQLDEALAAYRDALRLDAENAHTRCNLGMVLARKGDMDDAIPAYRAAIRISSSHGKAQYNLAVALARQEQFRDAVAAYRAAFSAEPRYTRAEFNLGPALADRGLLYATVAPSHVFRNPTQLEFSSDLAYLGNQTRFHDLQTALDSFSRTELFKLGTGVRSVESFFPDRVPLSAIHPEVARAPYRPNGALTAGGQLEDPVAADYRDTIHLDLEEARALYNFGNALIGAGELVEAVTAYRDAVRLDPKLAKAHHHLGIALARTGQLDEAIVAYGDALRLDPIRATVQNNFAVALARKGRLDESIAACRAAVALAPENALAHYNLGTALAAKGRTDEALVALRKAIQLDDKDAHARNNLGLVLTRKGQLDDALAAYRAALQIDPDLALAHNNLGVVLAGKGSPDEALAAYREAVRLDPKLGQAHNNLGVALIEKGHFDTALEALRDAARLRPRSARTHYNHGLALARSGKTTEALAAYREALELDPRMPAAQSNLGVALADSGQLDAAIEVYREALRVDPKYARARYNLGVALASKGQPDPAIEAYRDAVRTDPKLAEAHCNLGILLADRGRPDEAIAACRKAVEANPGLALAHYNLGSALMDRGDPKEAIVALRKAVELSPDSADANCNLGLALRDAGQLADAVEALARGHGLGLKASGWSYPSDQWVLRTGRMLAAEPKLGAVLRGEKRPADAAEGALLADLCRLPSQRRYAAATRLYAFAFADDAKLADDMKSVRRYNAACAAALAGCGQGNDDPAPDEKERARLREQARDWLKADLAVWKRQQEEGTAEARAEARQVLQGWQRAGALAGVRDQAALAGLLGAEREAWEKFWAEVEAIIRL